MSATNGKAAKTARKKKARVTLAVEDMPPHARDRAMAYDRCTALGQRSPGEKEAAEDELANDLDNLLISLREYCGRQHLAVRAAAVVIQPAGGLPPVIIPMEGREVPGCIVPFDYLFVGWQAR